MRETRNINGNKKKVTTGTVTMYTQVSGLPKKLYKIKPVVRKMPTDMA